MTRDWQALMQEHSLRCHPERSEGPPISSLITLGNKCVHTPNVRSLAPLGMTTRWVIITLLGTIDRALPGHDRLGFFGRLGHHFIGRSEERRVGEEGRSRW